MHGTLLVFFVLVPVVIGLATYLVPLMIGSTRIAMPGLAAAALWLFAFAGIAVVLSAFASRRLVEGRLDRLPARHPDAGGQRRPPLADGPLPARALGRRLGGQSRRHDPLAARRGDGLGQDAAVRLVGVRVVGGDDRARAARRDRARPDPARAPVRRLVRLLPHRRPVGQAVAGLAVRAVVRLRRARARRRHPGGDRGGLRRPRDRQRADARPGGRRHRRPHADPRALPRLRGRHRQEAEHRAAAPGRDRDDPVGRRARAAQEDALGGARPNPLDGADAVRRRRHRPVRDRPALRARARDLREQPRLARNGVRRRPRPLPDLGHGAARAARRPHLLVAEGLRQAARHAPHRAGRRGCSSSASTARSSSSSCSATRASRRERRASASTAASRPTT